MSAPAELPRDGEPLEEDDVLVVRRGPGANCSSIGSALDILFVTATAAGVVLAVTAATLSAMKGTKSIPLSKDREDAGSKEKPVAREG